MLQPVVRRTWAPRGRTPIHRCWDRRDRLSATSAISISPRRRHLGLYFDIVDHNIVTDDFEGFVERLLGRLPRGIIVVLDRWSVHRAGARRLLRRFPRRLQIEWLPAYAPQLNPVEQVWSRTKHGDLANYLPEDVIELGRAVAASLRRSGRQHKLLRSFFQHARLKL